MLYCKFCDEKVSSYTVKANCPTPHIYSDKHVTSKAKGQYKVAQFKKYARDLKAHLQGVVIIC